MNDKKRQTYFLWTVVFLIILSMIPLIMLSFYDHPSADDYSYACLTGPAWRSTRNLFAVITRKIFKNLIFLFYYYHFCVYLS